MGKTSGRPDRVDNIPWALLDTGYSVSLLGLLAMTAAQAKELNTEGKCAPCVWQQVDPSPLHSLVARYSGQPVLEGSAFCVNQTFAETVSWGRISWATGISVQVALGGRTVGTEPQCIVPFVRV